MKRIVLILSLISLLIPAQLFAGQVTERILANKILVVGTPGDFPPFTATTTTGQFIGLDIDLARNLAGGVDGQDQYFEKESSSLPRVRRHFLDDSTFAMQCTEAHYAKSACR